MHGEWCSMVEGLVQWCYSPDGCLDSKSIINVIAFFKVSNGSTLISTGKNVVWILSKPLFGIFLAYLFGILQ